MKQRILRLILGCAILAVGGCSTGPKKNPNEPSLAEIYLRKGIQYMNNGMLDVALHDLKHSVELDDKSSDAHGALGVLYQRLSRPADAEREFERAVSLDETNFSIANNYGQFLCKQGQYDKATAQFQKVMASKLYQSPWIALTNAGLCARLAGKRSEAETYLRKALDTNPSFSPALLEMAKLSLESGQLMSARAFVERCEAAAPADSEVFLLGIQVEQALGNEAGAEDYRNKLRAQFPNQRQGDRPPQTFGSH